MIFFIRATSELHQHWPWIYARERAPIANPIVFPCLHLRSYQIRNWRVTTCAEKSNKHICPTLILANPSAAINDTFTTAARWRRDYGRYSRPPQNTCKLAFTVSLSAERERERQRNDFRRNYDKARLMNILRTTIISTGYRHAWFTKGIRIWKPFFS